jgi:hypothetical protein
MQRVPVADIPVCRPGQVAAECHFQRRRAKNHDTHVRRNEKKDLKGGKLLQTDETLRQKERSVTTGSSAFCAIEKWVGPW